MPASRDTLGAGDHARISAAIREAEARTSGEIYCVAARRSDGYFAPAALAVLAGVLAMSLPATLLLDRLWMPATASVIVVAQLAAIAVGLVLLWFWPAARLRFVPAAVLHKRAHDQAVRQFLARNVHRTAARTGVLLFVSQAERYAEVLSDAGISGKVPQAAWDDAVDLLTSRAAKGRLADGFVEAIALVGGLLAEHFPPQPGDRNELEDHLAEV